MEFRQFDGTDLDWVLAAMVKSLKATLTPQRTEAMTEERLLANARSDFDKYHIRSIGPEMVTLAWSNGKRVGLVWISMDRFNQGEGDAWLLDIYVEPEFRRQGLGRELMRRAEEWAAKHGAMEVWLNVGGGNRTALALYGSQGYEVETMHLCKRLKGSKAGDP